MRCGDLLRRIRGPGKGAWHSAGGYTLIEMLVTLAVLGCLATLVVPVVELSVQRQKEQALRRALRDLRDAIDAYRRAYDQGRMVRHVGDSGYPPSLEALVDGVDDVMDPAHRRMYFLRRIPRDPFSVDGDVPPAQTWLKRSYASGPDRPEEGADVFDVLSRSDRVGLDGTPYAEW